jgi:hypothetical protein
MTMKVFVAGLAVAFAFVAGAPEHAQQKTKLTIYTALENDQVPPFKQAIEAAVPEVDVTWVRFDDRERILGEWSKRYESKAAPKN